MAANEGTLNGSIESDDTSVEEGEGTQINHEAQQERLARLEQGQILAQLVADPEISAVIAAKRAGKGVKVNVAEDEETQTPDPAEGLEADDPARATLAAMQAMLKQHLEPLTQRLSAVEGVAGDVRKKEVREQVVAAREKFKDLDQFKDDMVKISNEQPGLNAEELYVVAKLRKGKLRLAETTTFSEKPTQQPKAQRASGSTSKPPARPSGRKGFSDMLNNALNGLDLSSLGKDD